MPMLKILSKFQTFVLTFIILTNFLIQPNLSHKHSAHPLVILCSFDGFRWDYLTKHDLPNFNYLKSIGSHADFIYNSFATVTFPNHWTMVTGLYEESHGIVHNEMYDPLLNKTFESGKPRPDDNDWYKQRPEAEPIWITNQKAGEGRKSAASWVGGDVEFDGQSPIYIPYDYKKPYNKLIDEFIDLFTKAEGPINFGAIYFNEPDYTGHKYGPYSKEMKEKLESLDKTLGYLIDELKSHHLFDKVNLLITSDHGMEEISKDKVVHLEKHVDISLFKAYGRPSSLNIFLNKKSDLDKVYMSLKKIENVVVYKKKDIPDRLHYKNNRRIGDILIIAKLGYQIISKVNQTIDWDNRHGDHGYLNNQSSMYPIFISHGPAFKKDFKIKSFFNVDLYPLMCLILGVQPSENNGKIKNTLDMVVYNTVNTSFSYVYLLIFLIPISLVCTSCFFFCFCRKNSPPATNSTHYTSVTQNELLLRDTRHFELDDD